MNTLAGLSKPTVHKRSYTRLMDLYRRRPVRVPLLNRAIRLVFAARAWSHYWLLSRRGPRDQAAVDEWYSKQRLFFGLAVVRSGTMFLASFLNRALPNDIIQHEPNVSDYYHYARAMQSDRAARDYIGHCRIYELYYRLRHYRFRAYGEINPFLRRHARVLREQFPAAPMFHLVRDGRDVLRSLWSREIFGVNDPMAPLVYPPASDPYREQWPEMDRFERLCWLWQADNRFLREAVGYTVNFEALLSDYGYFRERFLDHLGLEIDQPTWQSHTSRVTNRTPEYHLAAYAEWRPEQKATFQRICGEEMASSGYSL